MKRYVTFFFFAFAVVLLLTSQAMAQAYLPVTSPEGVPGYQFTGLPTDGTPQYAYQVTTSPTAIPLVNSDGSGPIFYSGHVYNAGGPALTVWIVPPAAGGTVIVTVKYGIYDPETDETTVITIISGSQTFLPSGGPPTLTFTDQPGPTTLGSIINSPSGVKVTASDASFTGNITVALASNPTGATLHGTTTVLASAGVATFNDLWIDKATGASPPYYTLKASASGYTYATSNSFEIGPASTATTINLLSTPLFVYGQAVSFSATVTAPGSSATPTGTVTFSDAAGPLLGTATLSGGVATISATTLKVTQNPHQITATYSGNTDFNGSSSSPAMPAISLTITPANASVTPAAASKIYGTTEPTFSGSLTGFVAGDGVSASYSRTTGESVSGSPYTINATLSPAGELGNYNITYNTADFTITKAAASVTPNIASKLYGTSDPPLTGTLTGFLVADGVTASYSRLPGETVAGSPYAISAILSPAGVLGNYNITYNTANFTITTNATTTALTTSAATSVYGQSVTFTGTVTGASGGTPTGSVTFKDGAATLGTGALISGVATFSTSALMVPTHSITAVYGGDANFAGSTSSPAVTQTITPKALTVAGITASNKEYDGTLVASLNVSSPTLVGVVPGDIVTVSAAAATGAFANKSVGDAKTVTVSGVTLGGASAANYTVTQPTTTASITRKNLTVTGITANDKVYDGTTTATLNTSGATLVGVVSGDNVTPNILGATGTFADKEVGTAKTVTITGLTLSGADAGNYTLTQPTTTASITAATTNTGSVAGAGLISSPAGAYPSKPTFTGKGYFVFAVGYVKNNPLPIGLTTFVLKSNSLFSSTAFSFSSLKHESLDFSGAQATFTGTGKVNGSGNYGFLLSVLDGHAAKTSDKLRIKIWDKNQANAVFYDSQMGAADGASPTATVTGGVITITKSGGSSTAMDMNIQQLMEDATAAEIPTEYALHNAYPNPFNPSTTIGFDLPQAARVRLAVYDMLGREVAVLADEERPAGQHSVRFDAGKLSSGMYIYRLQAGSFHQAKKLMLMK